MNQSSPPASRSKSRALAVAAVLFLCLPLQSCFTAGLWASDIGGREKVCLTPISLTLDAVTLPLQAAVLKEGGGRRCR